MAAKTINESKVMYRVHDLASEPKQILPPVEGYENQLLVSLDRAIKPIIVVVPDVEEMVRTVKQNCQHPQDHLSTDESASIMLYTLECMPREHSFYYILNETLRSKSRNKLLPWLLYLRLLMFALSKLPPTKYRIVYRGVEMDVSDEYPQGKTFIWWAFSSCTSSINVLQESLDHTGPTTIFNIECNSAKDISQHSFYRSENEMLLYPARQFQVISSFSSGNQLKIIYLKEIQPPVSFIHSPQTFSTIIGENKRLQELIEQSEHQPEMNLSRQSLNDEDINIVVQEAIINKQCTKLNLSRNGITSVGASIIAKILNNNTSLKNLTLLRNRLCDTGVLALANTLSLNNSKIEFLDLQNNDITDEGAKYLAEMLKANTTLKCLLLGTNEISDRGVELLTNVLIHYNTTLNLLFLDRNKLVSDLSVEFLVKMLVHNQTLQCLYIDDCNLSEKGQEKLQKIVRTKNIFQLKV